MLSFSQAAEIIRSYFFGIFRKLVSCQKWAFKLKKLAIIPNSKLKVPVPIVLNNSNDEDINVYLDRLEYYLTAQNERKSNWPRLLLQFLGSKPFQLWNLELKANDADSTTVDWKYCRSFMTKSFGIIAAERKARNEFDGLKQTKSVESYINELRRLVRIMSSLPLICPSEGDIIRRFIDGCKPDIKQWLIENLTPNPYWQSAEEVFQMAINRAAVVGNASKKKGKSQKSKKNSKNKKSKGGADDADTDLSAGSRQVGNGFQQQQ